MHGSVRSLTRSQSRGKGRTSTVDSAMLLTGTRYLRHWACRPSVFWEEEEEEEGGVSLWGIHKGPRLPSSHCSQQRRRSFADRRLCSWPRHCHPAQQSRVPRAHGDDSSRESLRRHSRSGLSCLGLLWTQSTHCSRTATMQFQFRCQLTLAAGERRVSPDEDLIWQLSRSPKNEWNASGSTVPTQQSLGIVYFRTRSFSRGHRNEQLPTSVARKSRHFGSGGLEASLASECLPPSKTRGANSLRYWQHHLSFLSG